ncbi:MAG: sugar phosphate isomerase/epimerase [Verrucomicrobiota bacterium]
MNKISFMSANFVARELNYQMTKGWGQGQFASDQFFSPVETYAERFDAMLGEVSALGFSAIDLWAAHLNPAWATSKHIETARTLLAKHRLSVSSFAYYVQDPANLDKLAEIATALGCRLIGGGCAPALLKEKRADLVRALERNDLIIGYENHPEKSPSEVIEKIGDSAGGRIGVALDTGWFGSQGYDAAKAILELSDRLLHLHLKDIREPFKGGGPGKDIREGGVVTLKDMGHETCALGDGVVPVERCISSLKAIGYKGGISIEHEPEEYNPVREVKLSYERLEKWIRE